VVNYLKALLGDERNDVLFVGYQAAGAPGRDILRYGNKPDGYVEFEGKRYNIKAGIHALTGYSAHAGQRDLVNFVKRMKRKPTEVRIIHGDAGAKAALAGLLAEVVQGAKVWVP
jgi:metallo-beta-lactamase family protein